MSQVQAELKYSKEHEWVEVLDNERVRVGITQFAQEQLGDIVFIELPEQGATVKVNESMGTVESVKAVSDIYSPVSGEIVEVNGELEEAPEAINGDAYGAGWMVVIKLADAAELDELMTAEQYEAFSKEEE
ncbi:glycine cleavage system protein GcvH [Aneurinibacillus aneurinilyticus]|jgi:glycine cleavage system H protein|uniref:Glycine cleavage system H protein n=1 Tax=Aneurinibacillus aneurinilyticus ATCC 12856 TaxID=649747 RepID=U1YEM3_ANEAE|nr:glycine cleavage system protein GcvH [Aneurinibacillus aneurinilyticus]ERI10542.1 glycine cleavage system H protein [Aneurinibacillus aneurinilyticus ATCC 12856]MCI1693706.1 glycine cleavage system protein GcvH [Aneurinibacillus aneurinilyticus]MED0669459.1 glycine cleavage system protein GcvH [Aneurinibacillus aneurinilyticus]MED0709038.1 glycine cleavage system protein GcvH [Aneurinibacillus aneurinilyticus]MED0725432.1 glycine cleavage system protein GcvH [Aneurinibacillus aneurinilyticu